MKRHLCLWLTLVLLAGLLAGCPREERDPMDERLNELWKAGYGFNNPNNERRKKGLPPQNFDGTYEDE
jgi:hypothetical protein